MKYAYIPTTSITPTRKISTQHLRNFHATVHFVSEGRLPLMWVVGWRSVGKCLLGGGENCE